MLTFGGMKLVSADHLEDTIEDWSQVRSPSRARRRRWKHRQNIKFIKVPKKEFYQVGDTIYAHPVRIAELRREVGKISDRVQKDVDRMFLDALIGRL